MSGNGRACGQAYQVQDAKRDHKQHTVEGPRQQGETAKRGPRARQQGAHTPELRAFGGGGGARSTLCSSRCTPASTLPGCKGGSRKGPRKSALLSCLLGLMLMAHYQLATQHAHVQRRSNPALLCLVGLSGASHPAATHRGPADGATHRLGCSVPGWLGRRSSGGLRLRMQLWLRHGQRRHWQAHPCIQVQSWQAHWRWHHNHMCLLGR